MTMPTVAVSAVLAAARVLVIGHAAVRRGRSLLDVRTQRNGRDPHGAIDSPDCLRNTRRMTTYSRWLSAFILVTAVGLAASGCTYFRKEEADQTEATLAAAGFRMKPADTAKREAGLAMFPARKLVSRVRDGQPTYFYADPDFCKCLYYGNQQQYGRYRQLALQKQIAQEQTEAAEMNEDAAMDWGMWGPFW
jgi:hypothetical protein